MLRLRTWIALMPMLSLLKGTLAYAQVPLKEAQIYELINQVWLNRQQASQHDMLHPGDLLKSGANSRADLLFNEGTLARAAEQTEFRFEPDLRRFELSDGTVLIILRPGNGKTTLRTHEAKVRASGDVFWTTYQRKNDITKVGAFATPEGKVKVSNAQGEDTVELKAGQKVNIVDGEVGTVQTFSLNTFYKTSGIAGGLQLIDSLERYPPEVRKTLESIRHDAAYAFVQQQNWLYKQDIKEANNTRVHSNQGQKAGTELGKIKIIESAQR